MTLPPNGYLVRRSDRLFQWETVEHREIVRARPGIVVTLTLGSRVRRDERLIYANVRHRLIV